MKMKKTILAVVLAAAVGIIGLQQASAVQGPHGDGAARFQQVDEATKAKMEKFRTDTQDLRKQMAMKRAEEAALIRGETPDMDAVRKVAGEVFDLRSAMHEKAKAAGLFTNIKRGASDAGKNIEEHAKFDKFLADTQDLRKQMSVKRAEQRALMHSRNTDAGAVSKIAGELFDLRNTLHEKARAAGLFMPLHGMGKGHMGPGRQFLHGGDFGEFGMMQCPGPQGPGMNGAGETVDEVDTM